MSVCTGEQRTAADYLTAPSKLEAYRLLIAYVPVVAPRVKTAFILLLYVKTGFFLAQPGTGRQTP